MQIDNDYANELLLAARKNGRIQEFMDAVSGVSNYKLNSPNRQGCIRSLFAKELIKDQFLLHFDDIISTFWRGVFEKLKVAKLFGERVKIKTPGIKKYYRKTKNNPIHFLRYHGKMAVRNYINALYKRNLEQGCDVCGYRISINYNKVCPKCNSLMSTVYKFVNSDDCEMPVEAAYNQLGDVEMSIAIRRLLNEFANVELQEGTRAYTILKILTDSNMSKQICKTCKLCDADSFDIDQCTNYNMNIGKYLKINKTLVANKVSSIRRRLPKWLEKNNSDEARYLLSIIPNKFKVNQLQHI